MTNLSLSIINVARFRTKSREVKQSLSLVPLIDRRMRRRVKLPLAIVSYENLHPALSSSNDKLVGQQGAQGQSQTRPLAMVLKD